VTGEVDRLEIGTVAHEAISAFLAPFEGAAAIDPGALDPAAMDAIALARFRAHFGDPSSGALRIVATQVRTRLCEMVSGWLRPLAARTRLAVQGRERSIEAAWEGRRLTGRIDAVMSRDGRAWILDWKTGSSTSWILAAHDALAPEDRSTWKKGLASTQLPMYLLLHGAWEGRPPLAADAAYVMLGRARMDAECEVPLFADRDAAAVAWAKIEETLRRLISEIVDSAVPFAPADDLAAACPSCPFTTICGTGALALPKERA
jgi:hypothetical protein